MAGTLIFALETIPDLAGIRRVTGIDAVLADHDVAEYAFQRQRAQAGDDRLPPHLQRVVALACVLRDAYGFRVFSFAAPDVSERNIIQCFFDEVERVTPQLVSWDGGAFDLPVLQVRGLVQGVSAPRYWDRGDGRYVDSADFESNNYLGGPASRHLDLSQLLSRGNGEAAVPLEGLATLLGYPLGAMPQGNAWAAWQAGAAEGVRAVCEQRAVTTALVYLRWQMMRGAYDDVGLAAEEALLRVELGARVGPYWTPFLEAWPQKGA